jgi:hypothetical protein
MSVVQGTLTDLQLKRIATRLQGYEALINAAAELFELEGKGLEETCKTHAQNLMFYDITLQECKTVEETIRMKVEEQEGLLYRKYNENGNRALGQRDIGQYIKGDPDYVQVYEILLEVVHVRRQLEAIVEALKSMGWSIGHIVKLRVAQLEHVTL